MATKENKEAVAVKSEFNLSDYTIEIRPVFYIVSTFNPKTLIPFQKIKNIYTKQTK